MNPSRKPSLAQPSPSSGRAILRAIVKGERSPAWLAYQAKSTLRTDARQQELRRALRGYIGEHHRFLLQLLLEDLEHGEATVGRLEEETTSRLAPHEAVIERLCTIPGVDRITAWTLVAELGLDMSVFAAARAVPVGMGGDAQERLLFDSVLLSACRTAMSRRWTPMDADKECEHRDYPANVSPPSRTIPRPSHGNPQAGR